MHAGLQIVASYRILNSWHVSALPWRVAEIIKAADGVCILASV
jgi:hypothetical protein